MSDYKFEPNTNKKVKTSSKGIPLFSLILLNDDINEIGYVSKTLREVMGFDRQKAAKHTWEAHNEGLSTLIETYREAAEFYHDRLTAKYLVVIIEPIE